MIYYESDLRFEFDSDYWEVKKYDTHRYYKILSGAGLKGVDFLSIYREKQIIYIEVKNFRNKHPTAPPSYLILEDTKAFVDKISEKLSDTHKAIQVIRKYLGRKWWFRLFLRLQKWIPRSILAKQDWYFWYKVYELSQRKEQQVLVLWLEIDTPMPNSNRTLLYDKLDENLELLLKNQVQKVIISNLKNPTFRDILNVTTQANTKA